MKNRFRNPYVIYTFLFAIIFGISFSPFLLRGNGLIHEADSFSQSYPVFVYMGRWIRNLLQGNFKQYDFCIGLGEDIITSLNWHGFGDPFLILSTIFPERYSEIAYNVSMIVKFYFVGWSFLEYSKKHFSVSEYRICGALLYTFSTFSLFWGLNCWMFLNPMITMPLLLKGMDEILYHKKKISYWLIGSLFIQSMNGFYFLYMEIIISIFYFVIAFGIDYCQRKERFWKERVAVLYWTLINGLLGVLSGTFILIPAIIGFFQSSRGSNTPLFTSITDFFFYSTSFYINNFRDMICPNGMENSYTCSLIIVFGVLIAWSRWKERNKSVFWWLSVVLFVLFQTSIFGRFMNGFSYATGRWFFALYFFGILLTLEELQNDSEIRISQKYIYYGFCFLSIVISWLIRSKGVGDFIRFFVYAILIIGLPCVLKRKDRKWVLYITCILVCINALFLFGPQILGGDGYSAAFKQNGTVYEEIETYDVKEQSYPSFVRSDIYNTSWLGSLVNNYYGTSEYISILNGYVSDFYQQLHIDPGVYSANWILLGLDGRRELQSLLSVSEYTDYKTTNDEIIGKRCENDKYISFGSLYQKCMSIDQFETLNPMEKETALLNYVILESKDDDENHSISTLKEFNRIVLISQEFFGIEQGTDILKMSPNSYIRIRLDQFNEYEALTQRRLELYVRMKDMMLYKDRTKEIHVGNKTLLVRNSDDDYYIGSSDYWTNVTEIHQDMDGYYIDIIFPEEGAFTIGDIEVYMHTIDEEAIEQRNINCMKDMRMEADYIYGTISILENQYLLVTIPYSDGWKAYVDGQSVQLYKADIAFTSLFLEKGDHEIVFKYSTPGLKLGIIISCMSLLTIVLLSIYVRKSDKTM